MGFDTKKFYNINTDTGKASRDKQQCESVIITANNSGLILLLLAALLISNLIFSYTAISHLSNLNFNIKSLRIENEKLITQFEKLNEKDY